jgi:uncharacterized membrane protein YfcA
MLMLQDAAPAAPKQDILLTGLLGTLAVFVVWHLVVLVRRYLAVRARTPGTAGLDGDDAAITPLGLGIGFFTNFLDTLGIGSFATTTSLYRFLKLVPDERIPGTLNVGHAINAMAQTFIYTQLVPVEGKTLVLMIVAAIAGAYFGAGVVAGWPRRKVQIGMGICLAGAACVMLAQVTNQIPGGGDAIALTGSKLYVGIVINFILGILMTIGIGLYAPCLIAVSLLGMNAKTGFPIMMGSCAFLMPVAGLRFVKKGALATGHSMALSLGGIPATLIAAYIVKSLPLDYVRWLVVAVVLYTASGLLKSAFGASARSAQPAGS